MPVTDDSTATAIARYYDSHGTPNDRMMAYYLLGCTYRDLGDTPMQLECLQKAAEVADTTRTDCDYYTMVSIYGHLANLYHKQVLPEEELSVLKKLGESAKKDNDTITEIMAYKLQMGSCYLLKDTDRIFLISDTAQILYKQNGYNELAARVLVTPISISIDRGDYSKAKELLRIFENESGLFDTDGNIEKGWEYFYYNKGRYLLGTGKPDSAIIFFRKASGCGIDESIYKGLFNAYIRKHEPDSIAKYGQLFVNANDSAWLAKNSQTVAQMTAMYDYSRHKKQAEDNAVRAEHAEKMRTRLLLLLISLIFASAVIYNKIRKAYKKKMADKEKDLHALEEKYMEAMSAYTEADRDIQLLKLEYVERMQEMNAEKTQLQSDIQQLSSQNSQLKGNIEEKISALNKLENDIKEETSIYKSSLEEKNMTIETLRKDIVSLTAKVNVSNPEALEKEFVASSSYLRIRELIGKKSSDDHLTSAEWKQFAKTFSHCFPDTYAFLNLNHSLTSDQMRVCMLLKAGLSEGDILLLMDADNKRISRLKAQANKKLFGEENAKTLRNNLNLKK